MTSKKREQFPLMVPDDVTSPRTKRTGSRFIDDLDAIESPEYTDDFLLLRGNKAYRATDNQLFGRASVDGEVVNTTPDQVFVNVNVTDDDGVTYSKRALSVEQFKALLLKTAVDSGTGANRADLEGVPMGAMGAQTGEFIVPDNSDFFKRVTLIPMHMLERGAIQSFRVLLGDNSAGGTIGATTTDRLLVGFYDTNLNLLYSVRYSFTAGQAGTTYLNASPADSPNLFVDANGDPATTVTLPANYLVSLVPYTNGGGNLITPLVIVGYENFYFGPGVPVGTFSNLNTWICWYDANNFSLNTDAVADHPRDPFPIAAVSGYATQQKPPHLNSKG